MNLKIKIYITRILHLWLGPKILDWFGLAFKKCTHVHCWVIQTGIVLPTVRGEARALQWGYGDIRLVHDRLKDVAMTTNNDVIKKANFAPKIGYYSNLP